MVALLSAVFVIIIREQQAQMTTYSQQSVDQPDVVPPQIQDKIANYQQKLQEKQEKIDRYEQQLKGLKAELEEYKTQNALLMQANRPKPEPTVSQKLATTPQIPSPSKKPRVAPSISPKTTPQSQPSVKSIPVIEVAKKPSKLENSSDPQTLEPLKIASSEKSPIEAQKKLETPSENEVKLNEFDHDIAFIAQEPNKQVFFPDPSNLKTEAQLESPVVRSLDIDSTRDISNHYANNIAYGLAVAADEGQINHGTKMYRKVQTAIRLLRRGETKEEATRKAKVPTSVMEQLMKWGEKRPGSLIAATQKE
ncbi:hypothetical protein [Gloeothece citriformis]|uniref:hypothetical protein n=1 Tax=Gloeothece citriformis TaxID=2546356 RepID=UPI00030E5247|nr:hypothetical protein [Gloeothece citriformis]